MKLQILEYDFAVCKIDSIEGVDFTKEYIFLSKTDDEISLVCETAFLPANTIAIEEGWKALRIFGILDFGMIGIIAKIADILAVNGISVFVVSTYNTDYIFIKSANFDKAVQVLTDNGYSI